MRFAFLAAGLALAVTTPVLAQKSGGEVKRIQASASFKKASAALDKGHDRWVEDVIAITQIPAPPFKEKARAEAFADMLRARGLDAAIDEVGNVVARRKGSEDGPAVMVSAHLDTVFPEGTDVTVRREGNKLFAPGVGDDSAGLATLLSLVDAINAADIRTRRDLLIVGTVGEEGLGDLRGVRHLFTKSPLAGKIHAFFSLDGSGMDAMTTAGTGSKRYKVRFKGPGGHSYGAFGIVNPMAAMGQTVVDLYALEVPKKPRTTYSASVVGGGTSVNSIPEEVWLDVDMRSEEAAALADLETRFKAVVEAAVEAENAARSTADGKISAALEVIGDRPAGATPANADVIRFARDSYRAEGIEVKSGASSTDSNLPMSLGIPAITLSRVAEGGRAHAPDEWIGIDKAPNVRLKRILLSTILATAGVR